MEQILQPQQLSDIALLEKILSGEKNLFEFIIRRHNQRLFRIGMSVLNNDVEAEEAMQATYIKAYEHLGSFEQRSSFATWITRIMINECLAMKKKMQREEHEEAAQTKHNIIMATPSNILLNKELGNVLEHAIAQLPEKYRLVFILREVEQMSVKETGEALAIEEPNVKVRLNRAKTMLRDQLKDYMKDQVYAFHLTRCDRMVQQVFQKLNITA